MEPRATLLSVSADELAERVTALGGRGFHGRTARREVLERGVLDYGAMTSLPASLREALATELPILSGQERLRTVASDRTTKLLIDFPGREAVARARRDWPSRAPTSRAHIELCPRP